MRRRPALVGTVSHNRVQTGPWGPGPCGFGDGPEVPTSGTGCGLNPGGARAAPPGSAEARLAEAPLVSGDHTALPRPEGQ